MAKKKSGSKKKVVQKKKPAKKPAKKPVVKAKKSKVSVKSKAVQPSKKADAASPKKALVKASKVTFPSGKKGIKIGEVEDFFSRISVIAFTSNDTISVGTEIAVRGHTTDLIQSVGSMQIDHKPITTAKKGDSVGIKVESRCRKGDEVFRII